MAPAVARFVRRRAHPLDVVSALGIAIAVAAAEIEAEIEAGS
ncbi:hypothetical protein ACGFZJ_31225 [Streptomyces sp. NPDC048253]